MSNTHPGHADALCAPAQNYVQKPLYYSAGLTMNFSQKPARVLLEESGEDVSSDLLYGGIGTSER